MLHLVSDAIRRTIDLIIAAGALALLSPVWSLLCIAVLVGQRHWPIRGSVRLGRCGRRFPLYTFRRMRGMLGRCIRRWRLVRLPYLFNLLFGQLTLVGPRPVRPGQLDPLDPLAAARMSVAPGLVCLWWVRRRANIAYETELETDAEYVAARTLWGDFCILLRAAAAALYGVPKPPRSARISLLGLSIDNLSMAEALHTILERLDADAPHQLCFVNADCVNLAARHAEYRKVLDGSSLVVADGIGMKLAGRLLGSDIRENLCGTDVFPRLCAALAAAGKSIYLLGGRPGVATAVGDWIALHHPGAVVAGCRHGYFTLDEEADVVRTIAQSGASVLLVAFGAPRQDVWISRHLQHLGVKVAMGVGGLFDFYSGRIPRAPRWVRELGMEWLYRLLQEPGRLWKRYLIGNAVFLARAGWWATRQRLARRHAPRPLVTAGSDGA